MALCSPTTLLLPPSSSAAAASTTPAAPPLLLLHKPHRIHFRPRLISPYAFPSHFQSPPEPCPEALTTPPEPPDSTTNNKNTGRMRKKKPPRPSFHDQIMERWSLKISSQRTQLPWQEKGGELKDPWAALEEVQPHETQLDPGPNKRIQPSAGAQKRVGFTDQSQKPRTAGRFSGLQEKTPGKFRTDQNPVEFNGPTTVDGWKKISSSGDDSTKLSKAHSFGVSQKGAVGFSKERRGEGNDSHPKSQAESRSLGLREEGGIDDVGTWKNLVSRDDSNELPSFGDARKGAVGFSKGDDSQPKSRTESKSLGLREEGRRDGVETWKKPLGQCTGDQNLGGFTGPLTANGWKDRMNSRDDSAELWTTNSSGDAQKGVVDLSKERRGEGDFSQPKLWVRSRSLELREEAGRDGVGTSKKPLGECTHDQNLGTSDFGGHSVGLPKFSEKSRDGNGGIALVHEDGVKSSSYGMKSEFGNGSSYGGARGSVVPIASSHSLDYGARVSSAPVSLPWQRECGDSGKQHERPKSNTELAERMIPEHELRRLRGVSLRMKERLKVGASGVSGALVECIKEKWRQNEVVKLRFEGQSAINMRRIHEILESKTGGLVIWRSGSSVVLYRGMTYKLPCVQSYTENIICRDAPDKISKESVAKDMLNLPNFKLRTKSDSVSSLAEKPDTSVDASEIDSLLNELGPRFTDWSGREPLPVDADLLPHVIPGYKPPFRFLPHKAKRALYNKEMTYLRRLARSIPPHFALGRNREHHGLAQAMVKLWENSMIAKIAIKRGVPNTCNDRMAEEIGKLTGGVLISRNKEFVVFYRGNDFVPPPLAKVLVDREKLAGVRQEEEDQARQNASNVVNLHAKAHQGPYLAGTLAETMQAKIQWANEPSRREIEKMRSDQMLSKQESLIRCMERKLALAQQKVTKAEKALAQVQESLVPRELPNDLEILSDEERFLFRKMGLKMRSYLCLGRRGVFDGTIQNMHLSWKYRELVKILVKRKNFSLVKHIAISLEAESGGVLISLDKTTKGYVIIIYRGKNYERPDVLRPRNLLSRRQALARSIELQRREALKYHLFNLQEKIKIMKTELEQTRTKHISDDDEFTGTTSSVFSDDGDVVEEEGEEAYLETYQWDSDENDDDNDDASDFIQSLLEEDDSDSA